jgi:EAL domain-containing protein (putative c-di-GMP-specific phosphodiesterase class I)
VAIIAMAHSLGLEVVAEGVETDEQAEILRRHGCDQAQGFLWSDPVSADRLQYLLAEGMEALSVGRTPAAGVVTPGAV